MSDPDFSTPYRNVPFFGVWAEESADGYGRLAALAILQSALDRCREEDMRHDTDTTAALAYLSRHLIRNAPANQFATALNIQHPDTRWQGLNAAVNAIRRGLGL